MSALYIKEEINAMSFGLLLKLVHQQSPHLHCLIGELMSNARKHMSEWSKTLSDILMDINTRYWLCDVDNNILTKI